MKCRDCRAEAANEGQRADGFTVFSCGCGWYLATRRPDDEEAGHKWWCESLPKECDCGAQRDKGAR